MTGHTCIILGIIRILRTLNRLKVQPVFNFKLKLTCFFFFNAYLGVLILFLSFFAFLHCWLNAFAEVLRFADRMFYQVTEAQSA